MKAKHVKDKNEAVQLARERTEVSYGVGSGERQWLVTAPPDSYSRSEYHVQTHVLEGSPAKGYVLAVSRSSSTGIAIAYDCQLKEIGRFVWR